MTREEAIKYGIEWLKDEYLDAKDRAFINIALEELEQEPCEDAISRQAAIDALRKDVMGGLNYKGILTRLPSVTPKQSGWIPVSEGLPKEGKTVIASTKDGVYPEAKYTKEDGWLWAYEAGADYWVELENVVAWMPLPTKYKPESEE